MQLFCYGTLQFPEIMQAVTGCRFTGIPAVLEDYACCTVRGQVYPGIAPATGIHTEGIVYTGIGTAQLKKLDRFEGDLYERIRVCVRDRAGKPMQAWVYAVPTAMHKLLTAATWNREAFELTQLPHFLKCCQPV